MPAGVEIFNSVLNQLGSPAIYSDVFANRPAFGYTGRLFISTDTNEIYRDTGTAWVLISSGGGGVNIYNSDGTLTAARTVTMAGFPLTFSGGASAVNLNLNANAGVDRDLQFQTAGVNRWELLVTGAETGSNAGADFALRSYNDAGTFIFSPFTVRRRTGEIETFAEENITTGGQSIIGLYTNSTGTYAGGLTTTGGNPQSSNFNIYTLATAGSVTFANSNLVGTTVNVLRAQVQNAGTVTFPASATSALRAATNFVSQLQYNTSAAAGTFTHMANIHLQGIYEVSGGNVFTITNAYQLLINSLNENGYTGAQLALTNRWGIYQDGASDLNYFAANTLLGTTTNTGERLQVAGTARVTQSAYLATASGDVGIGLTSVTPVATVKYLEVYGAGGVSAVVVSNPTSGTGYSNGVLFAINGPDAYFYNRINSGSLYLGTQNTARVTVTNVGNVGIGTLTPSAPLAFGKSVYGNPTSENFFRIKFEDLGGIANDVGIGQPATGAIGINYTDAYGYFEVTQGPAANVRMRIGITGNVLIGTTTDPGYKIAVNGTNAYYATNGTQEYCVIISAATISVGTLTTGAIQFLVGGNTRAILTNDANFGLAQTTFGTSATRTFAISTGTAPSTSPADCFQLYSADITAGNAAAHFRTEGGAIIKVYQETTAVGSATYASPGAGSTVKTDDTFDGYTLQQVVKALRNQGLLA